MTHLGTKELKTERLILRRFVIDDAESVFRNWAHDDEVTKYMRWKAHTGLDETKKTLETWIQDYAKNDCYNWAIVLNEINEPIGSITAVKHDDDIKMAHIGYCIGKKWWNRGIVSEALSAAIKFFFEEVGLNRIEATYDPNNPNSGKVMAKCGMKYEGLMRQADKSNQGIIDSIEYGILAEDYR